MFRVLIMWHEVHTLHVHVYCRAKPNKLQAFGFAEHYVHLIPANTRHWAIVGLMLGQRLRRCPNFKATMAQCLVFAGIYVNFVSLLTLYSLVPVYVLSLCTAIVCQQRTAHSVSVHTMCIVLLLTVTRGEKCKILHEKRKMWTSFQTFSSIFSIFVYFSEDKSE